MNSRYSNLSSVGCYIHVRDILIYLANKNESSTLKDIALDVSETKTDNIRKILIALIKEGLVEDVPMTTPTRHFIASKKTRELYARDNRVPDDKTVVKVKGATIEINTFQD